MTKVTGAVSNAHRTLTIAKSLTTNSSKNGVPAGGLDTSSAVKSRSTTTHSVMATHCASLKMNTSHSGSMDWEMTALLTHLMTPSITNSTVKKATTGTGTIASASRTSTVHCTAPGHTSYTLSTAVSALIHASSKKTGAKPRVLTALLAPAMTLNRLRTHSIAHSSRFSTKILALV